MWLLSFLPDSFLLYVVNGILIVGAISSFLAFFVLHKILNKIPALAPYYLLFQIVSAVLLVAGIYFKGGYGVEMEWRAKVAELEEKLKVAKEESAKVNTVVETKVVEKTKVIREKSKSQIEYIDRVITQDKEVIKYIEMCPVPKPIIEEHNKAAMPPEVVKEINKAAEGAKK